MGLISGGSGQMGLVRKKTYPSVLAGSEAFKILILQVGWVVLG